MRHVQALCQAQNNGTKLGVKGVAGKRHEETHQRDFKQFHGRSQKLVTFSKENKMNVTYKKKS